jgi:hypothetical protein
MSDNEKELIASLKELRDACAAALRTFETNDGFEDFLAELRRINIEPGFGKRADDLIKKLESA